MLRYRGLELRLLVEQRAPQTGEPVGVRVGEPVRRVRRYEPAALNGEDGAPVVDIVGLSPLGD